MRLFPEDLALANLRGGITPDERGYMTKAEAIAFLKEISGVDLGENVDAWAEWVRIHNQHIPPKEIAG